MLTRNYLLIFRVRKRQIGQSLFSLLQNLLALGIPTQKSQLRAGGKAYSKTQILVEIIMVDFSQYGLGHEYTPEKQYQALMFIDKNSSP